jgi:hypothetical protein
MTKLEQIEKAVAALSPEERALFRDWFEAFEAQAWDEQIERDAKSGRLDDLAQRALADHRAGRRRKL